MNLAKARKSCTYSVGKLKTEILNSTTSVSEDRSGYRYFLCLPVARSSEQLRIPKERVLNRCRSRRFECHPKEQYVFVPLDLERLHDLPHFRKTMIISEEIVKPKDCSTALNCGAHGIP